MIGMPCTVHECKTCQLDLVYIGQQSAVMTAEGRSILGTFGSMRIGWPSAFFFGPSPTADVAAFAQGCLHNQ